MINFDYASLRRIGINTSIINQLHTLATTLDQAAPLQIVRITAIHKHQLTLHNGHGQFSAPASRSLPQDLRMEGRNLAVGDWGLASVTLVGETKHLELIAQMPAINRLTRRHHETQIQTLVSNVDVAFIVMGLDHDFNLRRLERYVSMVRAADVEAVVLLSKADLHTDAALRQDEVKQRFLGEIAVITIDGTSPETRSTLAAWMVEGQTLVLLGSSGAGKSTLTNTLAHTQQVTGAVRESDQRGRHTTSSRSLHQCDTGACIIDTPGLRALQLSVDETSFNKTFTEIHDLSRSCQFRDCQHESEPGCMVRATVEPDRLRNFKKLQKEIRRVDQTPLEKIAERSKWKALIRSVKQKNKIMPF